MVFFNFCYFSCMKYTTLSVAAILLYTAPAFLMVMSAVISTLAAVTAILTMPRPVNNAKVDPAIKQRQSTIVAVE
jgi:hypothetical protein